MKLPAEFLQLPLRFDAARLQAEIDAVPASAWRPHPQGFADNDALLLVTAGGGQNDDLSGTMAPTPVLQRCPYLQQVMASFATVIGRSRLMRIGGSAEAQPHFDENYYWHQRMRIHVPIRTSPGVRFHCGERSVHMRAGECWVFDTWKIHKVTNPDSAPRVHLVCDTVGSGPLWDLLAGSSNPFQPRDGFSPRDVPFSSGDSARLHFETTNAPSVMTPWEQESLIAAMLDDLRAADPPAEVERQLQAVLERFRFQWRGLWARFGAGPEGRAAYRRALVGLGEQLEAFAGQLQFPNGADVVDVLEKVLIGSALRLAAPATKPSTGTSGHHRGAPASVRMGRPIVIAAAPRSGSTLLFETMARSPAVVTVGGESHGVIEGLPALNPAQRDFASNALTAADADAATIEALRQRFVQAVRAHEGEQGLVEKGPEVRLLEKTPKNALRLPFLKQVFPGMQLVYLVRHPRENISSIIDAWRSGRFVTYPELPGWGGAPWSLLLIPGWRDLPADDVATIAARQWQAAHEAILDALEGDACPRVVAVRYEALVDDPQGALKTLCSQLDLAPPTVDGELPLSRHTLTRPDPEKWKRNADALERVLPMVEPTWQRIQRWLEAGN